MENARSPGVVAPETFYARLAGLGVLGIAFITVVARPQSPLAITLAATAGIAVLSLALTRMPLDSLPRSSAIVIMAMLAAPIGYFFGPNSAFAAILALLLALAGLLSARQPGMRTRLGWLVTATLCLGQFVVVILVAYDVLPDRSLSPIRRFGQSPVQTLSAAMVAQAVFVCAFLAGRAAQKRYRQIVLDGLEASRHVAIREALLEEARADYEQALALQAVADATTADASTSGTTDKLKRAPATTGKTELVTEPTTNQSTNAPTKPPIPRLSVTVLDDGTHGRWTQALRSKLRMQDIFVLGVALLGVYFTASLIKSPTPRMFSLAAIIGIVVMVATRTIILYGKPNAVVAWPYPFIALLSAGPAYGFGLHAGFAAIVATVLFSGRLFRSPVPEQQRTSLYSIFAVCIGHASIFALVMAGVLPDTSNLPLRLPGLADYGPYLNHAMVQFIYIAAYLIGGRIDREFVRAADIAREAYAEAVRADARLQLAQTELDAALKAEGLFSGTAVGPYTLGPLLGRGGMGEVYRAEANGKPVALKLLRADRLGDPVALERFKHEANLLTRIDSPYCARVIEVSGDRAVPYLAMEYVDGPSLSMVLRERGRLEGTELVALVDDLTRGLGDVHAAGVVHLDLKPSNVLRGAQWKIVDFGIARLLTGEAHRKVAGTPPYMAPEQALGESLDARTDLYSLSLILYRAITGRPAYTGTDAAEIATRARMLGPPDPRELVTINDDLAFVLRIGLAANMSDRFADTTELRSAFTGALGNRLDPRIRARGQDLLARTPWAPGVALISGPRTLDPPISLRSTR